MEASAPTIRDLAHILLTLEANSNEHIEGEVYAFSEVFAKLRAHLSRLVGVIGFQALVVRALALAKAEAHWLQAVHVQADATLEGFSEAAQLQPAAVVLEGSTILLAQLLGLLSIFIGETLTMRLVTDIWPEAQGHSTNFNREEIPHE